MAVIGEVIDGKYEILKKIGEGGMSSVYLAMDQRLNKQWAVKEIKKRARDMNNEIVIQSAMAEANMIKKLDHPALPRIVDIIDNGNMIFVIMDYIEGETLGKVIKEKGAQPQEYVVEWALQLCDVLDYLHTRRPPVIYRDMKPENIMLKPDGNIKLIDFGIAREYKEHKTSDTVGLGTRGYAAPEQFGGKAQTDARTDIYCLGMTMHHLLTGKNPSEPPYEIYPIRHWDPLLSTGLEAIVQKCINLDPDKRYQSCAELTYALYHYGELGADYIARQRRKLHYFIMTTIAMVICLAVGILGMGMKNYSNDSDYDNYITMAEKAPSVQEKVNLYTQAIQLKPIETEAYIDLLDAFKEDTEFTTEEESIFNNLISPNITKLKEQTDYPELAFAVGKSYWYYYNYGQNDSSYNEDRTDTNQLTRMKSSVQWFDDAVSLGDKNSNYYQMALVYRDIGKFNRDITLNQDEASDKGMYLPYWENMKDLVSLIRENGENEIAILEVYRLTVNAIETYAKNFKKDAVNESDMRELYSTVKSGVQEVNTTSDKTEHMKNEILARFSDNGIDHVDAAITNAFRS